MEKTIRAQCEPLMIDNTAGGFSGVGLNQAFPEGFSLGISQTNPFVNLSPSPFLFISIWP